ncbi:hypothetical protein TrispH2_006073 [Trichoplax sp. H2]|nr:hypothetical protein TrispH2_006073 [Trichoplax sp. H2]|eukprot:RDD43112.1 hypothetical protein TrispH2_006073 [Trichoplax sp. H2]
MYLTEIFTILHEKFRIWKCYKFNTKRRWRIIQRCCHNGNRNQYLWKSSIFAQHLEKVTSAGSTADLASCYVGSLGFFTITATIYPALLVLVQSSQTAPDYKITHKFFIPLAVFLAFSVSDFLGEVLAAWVLQVIHIINLSIGNIQIHAEMYSIANYVEKVNNN